MSSTTYYQTLEALAGQPDGDLDAQLVIAGNCGDLQTIDCITSIRAARGQGRNRSDTSQLERLRQQCARHTYSAPLSYREREAAERTGVFA